MAPLVWAAGSLVMLAPAALGLLSLRRLQARARTIRDGRWLRLVDELHCELGIRRSVLLLAGDADCMPMTWGLLRARVLLPADAERWPAQRRRLVLLHELAHVRRGDFAADLAGKLARAVHWFNPLAWVALRRLAVERERACDDLVLAANSDAGEYAEHLLHVAAGLRSPRLAAALAIRMARASTLEGRLLAILDRRRSRGVVSRAAMLGSIVVMAAVLAPLSMLRAAPAGRAGGVHGGESTVSTGDSTPESPADEGMAETNEGIEDNRGPTEESPAEENSAENDDEPAPPVRMGVGVGGGGLNYPGGYPPAPAPPK